MISLATFQQKMRSENLPAITAGDTVKVYQKVKEGEKTRVQIFEGLVIARKHGSEPGATITVRKISGGIGVERVFPLYLPTVEKIEMVRKTKVRRAKLYYIRTKTAKETRKKLKSQKLSPVSANDQGSPAPSIMEDPASESK